jgi:hypothetical protein
MVTAGILLLAFAGCVITFVGYLAFQGLDASRFPVSIPLLAIDGPLPPDVELVARDLEQFGFAVHALSNRAFVIRPVNYWEKGMSASPRDVMSAATVELRDGRWYITARKGLGVWLVVCTLASGGVFWSGGAFLSFVMACLAVGYVASDWAGTQRTYERLGEQLSRRDHAVQQLDAADEVGARSDAGWRRPRS